MAQKRHVGKRGSTPSRSQTQESIEDLSGDPLKGDGCVMVFRYSPTHAGVQAIIPTGARVHQMLKLWLALKLYGFINEVVGFKFECKNSNFKSEVSHWEITFAIPHDDVRPVMARFIEYVRQSRVICDPIISDVRHIKML